MKRKLWSSNFQIFFKNCLVILIKRHVSHFEYQPIFGQQNENRKIYDMKLKKKRIFNSEITNLFQIILVHTRIDTIKNY